MNIVSGGRGELASYPNFFVCGIYRFFVLSTINYRNFETWLNVVETCLESFEIIQVVPNES